MQVIREWILVWELAVKLGANDCLRQSLVVAFGQVTPRSPTAHITAIKLSHNLSNLSINNLKYMALA